MMSMASRRVAGLVPAREWAIAMDGGIELGRGGFGVVYKASRQGSDFAVKVFEAKDKASAIQDRGGGIRAGRECG